MKANNKAIHYEEYLRTNGLGYRSSTQYGKVVTRYINWLKEKKLTPSKVKRSQFLDFMQLYKDEGNVYNTLVSKERAVRKYHEFLGTKFNPAKSWLKRKKRLHLPPPPLEMEVLQNVYASQKPKSPADYRDRCMLGLILFQALRLGELEELRLSDLNFEEGTIFIVGQARTNPRTLKLEGKQAIHLYEYVNKYRKELLQFRSHETDKLFISKGNSVRMGNALSRVKSKLKRDFPHIDGFKQLRGSIISHWDKEEGIMEAMVKSGQRYLTSTVPYQTQKYDEIKDELALIHPMEKLNLP